MTTHLALLIALVPVTLAQYDFSWAPKYDVTKPPATAPAQPLWTQYFKQVNPTAASPDITSCNSPNPLVWGATFDDGPSPSTPMVLDYLKLPNVSVKATFWVIGANVQFLPEVLARTYAEGHQIGLHTWSHSNLSLLSDDQIISELVYSARTVYEVTKVYPKYYRPPYGAIDARVRALANTMGLTAVTWNRDSLDWSYVGKSTLPVMISSVTGTFRGWVASSDPNGLSLEHDLYEDTAAAIPPSMDILIRAGRVIQTVSQCIGDTGPYENTVLRTFFANGFFENPATGNGGVTTTQTSASSASITMVGPSGTVSGPSNNTSTAAAAGGGSSTGGSLDSGNSVSGSSDGSKAKGLSTGGIVGIAVGCGVAVLVGVGGVLGIRYQRKKKADAAAAKQTLGDESAYVTALEPVILFVLQLLSANSYLDASPKTTATTQKPTVQTVPTTTAAVPTATTTTPTTTTTTVPSIQTTTTTVPDPYGGGGAMNFEWAPPAGLAPVHEEWTAYFKQRFPYAVVSPDIESCADSVDPNYWGISFDDGPTENTHVVLDYFAKQKLSTTFWVIGSSVPDAAQTLKDSYAAGHDIGSHTWSHKDLTTLNEDEIVAELVYGARAVFEVTGNIPRYFRPPYGAIDDRVRRVAAQLGLQAVRWALDTQDWANVETNTMQNVPEAFETWIKQGVTRPITLAHDLYPETVAVVAQSMDLLLKAGKRPVKLSQCLDVGSVYGNDALETFFKSGLFQGGGGGGGHKSGKLHPSVARYRASSSSSSGSGSGGISKVARIVG
ncbi:hypothetical protein CcCBS67573_g05542 [Chytriomyces confervae]|uniref:NodB homology domain-containing protein n=1 Tax=Chytriomyces confervae TaxID=246404 RepID=A0A507FBR3_9FUNG|nr:hypothetical protein CcCBS67573_g05542 [Chytriomyces confervae]